MNYLNGPFYKSHVIAGFGNPLLDISVQLRSNDVLAKFNLKPDGQKEVNNDEFHQLLDYFKSGNYELSKNPGGCTQNTLRIVQSLLNHPGFCVFFGGLGDDNDGDFIESEVKKCGVETRYVKHSDYPTGKVAALISGENRSLVAHLGAAERFSVRDFKTPENYKLLEEVLLVYVEGFFITHSSDVALEVIKMCRSHGVVVVFNISGAYVANSHPDDLISTVTLADIIIGNGDEFKALAGIIGIQFSTMEDVVSKTYSFLYEKSSPGQNYKLSQMNSLGKIVVVTQGKDPVLCVCSDKKLVKFTVPNLHVELIKDPTGAGDSFAAAFLVAFIQGRSMTECVAYGYTIAQKVIQQVGVHLPSDL